MKNTPIHIQEELSKLRKILKKLEKLGYSVDVVEDKACIICNDIAEIELKKEENKEYKNYSLLKIQPKNWTKEKMFFTDRYVAMWL